MVRKGRSLHIKPCIMLSVFVDVDSNKRRPTSRPVIGTEIQEDCNFEAHVYYFSYRLGFISSRWYMLLSQLPYSHSVQLCRYILLLVILVASYTKIFGALGHHQASQPNTLNMVRYRKALHSAVWVQLGLIVCYVPYFTLIILCEVRCPNDIRIEGIAIVLVFFNSTLNPFLYCWKISEVRRAVKQTIRQVICYA